MLNGTVDQLTQDELIIYLNRLYGILLEHRYRYYVLDSPIVDDHLYDLMEREYNEMAEKHGTKTMDMVDFNPNDLLAIEAKNRVDSSTDSHSLWEKEMFPVWEKLGRSAKEEKSSKSKKNGKSNE